LGISRGELMDYVLQKSSELVVSCITPVFTEHCEVKLDPGRIGKRMSHWQQVIISACEQSGRSHVPRLQQPVALASWLNASGMPVKLVFDHQQGQSLSCLAPGQAIALLTGPEGGLSAAELEQAREAGFQGIRLGPRVMRTETAPVAALAVLQYLRGDFQL
ncbi:MAG: 16S rRNA (uracil(1498)-N(3))-methyltransferase, partial [Pseudohongiellaceae bacterium]